MIKRFKKDPALLKIILTIAIPIALQNLLTSLTQMMDTIMLGELGDIELTASSLANQVFFIFSLFIFGASGGASILTAQYWGKQELKPIRIVIATMIRVVSVAGMFLTVIIYLVPEQMMRLFSSDEAVIKAGVDYLVIIAPIYLFFGISNMLTALFRSIEVVKLAVISNAVTLFVNIGLNYIFIFGKLGAPRMGLQGAALATLIARFIELSVVTIYVFNRERKLHFTFGDLRLRDSLLTKDLRKYCTPVVCNELAWALGITLQAALFGHMNTIAVSANTIIGVVQNLATLVIFGVANAAGVIIGKTIGEGHLELAKERGRTLQYFAFFLGLLSAGAILIGRNVMVDFYNVLPETKALAKEMLVITAIVVFFVSTTGTSIVGIMRGGGDAKFSLVIEIISLWCFSVPLGYLAGLVLKWPVLAVYALFKSDEVVKAILCWIRLAGDKWLRVVTREEFQPK